MDTMTNITDQLPYELCKGVLYQCIKEFGGSIQ